MSARKRGMVVPAVEVARLSRLDYAASRQTILMGRKRGAATRGSSAPDDGDVVASIVGPDQVSVTMSARYAAELLDLLRSSPKPPRGMRSQISVDCPVEIVVDADQLEMLIDGLEAATGGAVAREG